MTKSDLIERLSASFQHLSSKEVESAIREILEQMAGTLQSGERIEIRGFGSFSLHHRAAGLDVTRKRVKRSSYWANLYPISSQAKSYEKG